MLKRLSHFSVVFVLTIPLIPTNATPNYNIENFSSILQAEYNKQLNENQKTHRANAQRKQAQKQVLKAKQQTDKAPPRKYKHRNAQKIIVQAPAMHQPTGRNTIPEPSSLFAAASGGNLNAIKQLIDQGVNINSANNERETALHMAAAHGHYSTVIYLINHGANLHSRTIKNWLPLHHAARFRHANIANYLKNLGSSPYARTSDGLNALDMAENTGDRRMIHALGGKR